ncbi:MAG: hypothetical protein J6K96_06730 [Treponema sp.]|nr:hypothetical protein [Treponema sp.]
MNNEIKKSLQNRNSEIVELIQHLEKQEKNTYSSNPSFATEKAAVFLLLYNEIEGIVFLLFEFLFDNISINVNCFSKLKNNLQNQYRKYNDKLKIKKTEYELLHLDFETYIRDVHIFSGNLDARLIRCLLKDWGIMENFHFANEEKLKDIKDYRNSLAHGERAFKEVGRNYSIQDINCFCVCVYEYLLKLEIIFSNFIEKREYLNEKNLFCNCCTF